MTTPHNVNKGGVGVSGLAKSDEPKQPKDTKSLTDFVTIEEDYFDFRGQCYYAWRVEGAKDWFFKPTGHTGRPYYRWKKLSQVEYHDRLRRYGERNDLVATNPEATDE